MRMQMLKIVVVLLIAGSGDARPQKSGADSAARAEVEASNAGWRGIRTSDKSHDIVRDDSSRPLNDTKRDLKDLQYMDQSLRTVATQLLNVTNPLDVVKMDTKEFTKVEHGVATTQKNDASSLIKEVNSEISNMENMGVSFGRPINSKFSYFEISHPGEAMALTEEELEREMSTTRLITAYKNQPTTTGGISTWILLNPPSTTVKSVETEKTKMKQPFQTEVRLTVRPSSSINKIEETASQSEKIEEKTTPQLTSIITTEKVAVITKKPTSSATIKKIVTTSTLKPEKITQNLETIESSSTTTLKATRTTTVSTSTETNDGTVSPTTAPTTKKSQASRTTSKPKATTPRVTSKSAAKPTRAGQQGRPKPATTKRTTVKPEAAKNETTTSTGKIEKVTFKPVPIITTPQNKPEKPIFVTKIKASMLLDTQRTTLLPAPAETTTPNAGIMSNLSGADLMEVPVRSKPIGTKPNNILKVQLKTPVDGTAQIEIEPIKVNASILKIEKVDKVKIDEIVEKDTDDLNNSPIDLKFDFNPELTRISVETQTEAATTSATSTTTTTTTTTAASTTTKRPRHNSKRKKNKNRRRKRPSPAAPSSTTVSTAVPALTETTESTLLITDASVEDNAVQESKIAPETKVAANATKNKKKQPQKAISTQIYNFLSREVMPSFGVMSLVGLGLGLASYFLYPFGGTISRRNYEVEPNYKYNMDEYGGNYGQREEEVLSKVFQGMTNHESKYPGTKDLSGGYYHYQHYDGAYDGAQTTKKIDARYPAAAVSTSPIYRTAENIQSAVKYRNTDLRYPETQTTPVYYDRKRPDLAEAPGSANRQFVVGNVPKEYAYDVKAASVPIDSKKGYVSTEVGQTQFERDAIAQGINFPPNSAGVHSYGGLLEATTGRPDDGYEEIEITPTAVAVEHGPRYLKVKRAAAVTNGGDRRSRSKRESVIQVIPSKHELQLEREEEEKEEDLSNEILDIIDLALPGGQATKHSGENNEVEDLAGQRRKQQEESNTHAKESTTVPTFTAAKHAGNAEETTNAPESADFTSPTKKMSDDSSSTPSGNSDSTETHPTTSSSPKDAEETTVEWFESSTTKKPAEGFSLYNFVKKVAEIKFRLGLTILKHASEGFARYLGHVQKRINGEE